MFILQKCPKHFFLSDVTLLIILFNHENKTSEEESNTRPRTLVPEVEVLAPPLRQTIVCDGTNDFIFIIYTIFLPSLHGVSGGCYRVFYTTFAAGTATLPPYHTLRATNSNHKGISTGQMDSYTERPFAIVRSKHAHTPRSSGPTHSDGVIRWHANMVKRCAAFASAGRAAWPRWSHPDPLGSDKGKQNSF
jgi:hypothetical protein